MKKLAGEFFRRGMAACGVGPLVLAVLYLALDVQFLTVQQVCTGIFSLSALAFLAGGLNVLYQIERLPLPMAILIHGGVLYAGYLGTYLLNGWLDWGTAPVLVFTGIFVFGYLVIWAVIYSIIRRSTEKINRMLQEQQKKEEKLQ